jgi:hypothetical protein
VGVDSARFSHDPRRSGLALELVLSGTVWGLALKALNLPMPIYNRFPLPEYENIDGSTGRGERGSSSIGFDFLIEL